MKKDEKFYAKLKDSLNETTEFPSSYMFKFIIPTSDERFGQIEKIFDNLGAVITSKPSKNGNFTSITIVVDMADADAVILKYKEVGAVDGVISL